MMKVLIVDDNEDLTALIKEMLETEGICHVKTAANGQEGYVAFLHFKPDIILTDIEMPVKNGLEMIRDIRIHNPGIKTIYMSGDLNRYRAFLEEEKTIYKVNLLNKPFTCSRMMGLFHEYQKDMEVLDENAYTYVGSSGNRVGKMRVGNRLERGGGNSVC